MKSSAISRILMILAAALPALLPATADACAACMGDVNSKFAPATNDAIFLMLGLIGLMLGTFVGCAFYLFKRARAPLPPHAEVAQSMTSDEGTPSYPHSA
ncbi:MAG TPA: hypothetical protein VGM54_16415 [Chthoniobacter sp.]|jgi:hypothetical protein